MDVSGETADLLIKEGVQAAEGAIKLAGVGLKNVAALLIAISQQNYKVVGKTTSKRLARDPAPAEVVHLKKEDIPAFTKLAKQYAESVSYLLCKRFGIKCELPDASRVTDMYNGWTALEIRQALSSIQDMSKSIGGSIDKNIAPPNRTRGNMHRTGR